MSLRYFYALPLSSPLVIPHNESAHFTRDTLHDVDGFSVMFFSFTLA
jgi:hypothetical protein